MDFPKPLDTQSSRVTGPDASARPAQAPPVDAPGGTATDAGALLGNLPVRLATSGDTPDDDPNAIGSQWAREILQHFEDYQGRLAAPSMGTAALGVVVAVLYLVPELHNLFLTSVDRVANAHARQVSGHGSRVGANAAEVQAMVDELAAAIDAGLGRPSSHFFVLRTLLARKLAPVENELRQAFVALARPDDGERCAACLVRAVVALRDDRFGRAHADATVAALRQLAREIEDAMQLMAFDLDDAQPPLGPVMDATLPAGSLGLWLIRTRADLIRIQVGGFYEEAGRPRQPAIRYERTLERLRRKVEQSVRVIDRLCPGRHRRALENDTHAPWQAHLAELRRARSFERRGGLFRDGISLLGRLLKAALDSAAEAPPVADAASPSPTVPNGPDMQLVQLTRMTEAGEAGEAPSTPPDAPAAAVAVGDTPSDASSAPLSPPSAAAQAQAGHLLRQASQRIWLDLQSVQRKLTRLYEAPASALADVAPVFQALLAHVDALSRGHRSLGFVFVRQMVLIAARLPEDAPGPYDEALYSAACNLETMPIDAHARRFFESPMSNLLALLHGLQRAAPEQALLFCETLDLCLSTPELQRLPGCLEAEFDAMREPPGPAFRQESARHYLACVLHCLAAHLPAPAAAGLALRMAEAFAQELPPGSLRSPQALRAHACATLLESRYFYRPEVPRAGRVPEHRHLNLHDAGMLVLPLLEAVNPGPAQAGDRPLRVTVGGYHHQKADEMPPTRRAVLDWAGAKPRWRVQEHGAAELWLSRDPAGQLPGRPLL